ncbi:hypothetical protein YWY31_15980 [Paenibacillus illinoisensis]
MKMGKTSDTSGLTYVASLSDELQPVFEQAEMKYPNEWFPVSIHRLESK